MRNDTERDCGCPACPETLIGEPGMVCDLCDEAGCGLMDSECSVPTCEACGDRFDLRKGVFVRSCKCAVCDDCGEPMRLATTDDGSLRGTMTDTAYCSGCLFDIQSTERNLDAEPF